MWHASFNLLRHFSVLECCWLFCLNLRRKQFYCVELGAGYVPIMSHWLMFLFFTTKYLQAVFLSRMRVLQSVPWRENKTISRCFTLTSLCLLYFDCFLINASTFIIIIYSEKMDPFINMYHPSLFLIFVFVLKSASDKANMVIWLPLDC